MRYTEAAKRARANCGLHHRDDDRVLQVHITAQGGLRMLFYGRPRRARAALRAGAGVRNGAVVLSTDMSTVTNMCVRRKGRTDGDLCMRLAVEGVKMTIRQIKLILEQQASFPTLAMWTSVDTKSRARRHERRARACVSQRIWRHCRRTSIGTGCR